MNNIISRIAQEMAVKPTQVSSAVTLLDEGATVPFIARYRKEVTSGLDDTQLRHLEERLGYLRELEERRTTVLKSIQEQGKLTESLKQTIKNADTKTRLEDLYRPYMKKRRTKAQIAREAGLESLAIGLLNDPSELPELFAKKFLNKEKEIDDVATALEGARQILMEMFAENPELVGELRDYAWDKGQLQSKVVKDKEQEGAKFSDYFDAIEAVKEIPSHRALAMFRGQSEGVLQLKLFIDELDKDGSLTQEYSIGERKIAHAFNIKPSGRAADAWLQETVRYTWRIKLLTRIDLDIKRQLKEQAEAEAIKVFANNLSDLLLAAPAGPHTIIGLDPGIRTGVKAAVISGTGKLLDTVTIYPHAPRNQWDASIHQLSQLAKKYHVTLIGIGNGTASRETERLVSDMIKQLPQLKLSKIVVSEAGASVYSASALAAKEFPELDVSLRGAVSIARRLQDPLAELVKIDPKSIGVGQYQHDVNQSRLARSLVTVIEDCVNSVGVDVNTASAPLLAKISGLNSTLADNIVVFRDQEGPYKTRSALKKVPRLGPKAFEQCAGFLRIHNGDNPMDASAVHPEAYAVIKNIISKTGFKIEKIVGNKDFLRSLLVKDYTDERFGEPTVKDIIAELEKPGRDPRPEFKTAAFKEGVEKISDLKEGMKLEGVATNVTNFGAFIDIGVHQDGLVHISELADHFVSDPRKVVSTGDVVSVRVLEVDEKRRRISLSMRKEESNNSRSTASEKKDRKPANIKKPAKNSQPVMQSALADALLQWKSS